ncbi:MAG: ATP-binding protein [Planctomycetota bacterium]|nr:ATP-binding protein [Planctomycetota bacterium]
MAETLFSLVADPTWIVELSRKELLEKLRWSDRFAYRSLHEFPDPQIPYRPLEQSVDRLKHALRNLPGGYIGLFGTPGSGKSTMLSRTLRELPFRLVRYYAYVPDDRTSRRLRGESLNFLHDVGLQLNDAGFWTSNVDPSSRTQLLDRFHRQLDLLHEDWENNGQATVIMIDGLDHIPREQTPERSLLDDLPDPDQVLEGVFILLGSQTDQLLPSRIRHMVSSPERRIETQPLSRAATLSIIADSELPCALTDEETNLVSERCDGHPLALAYILNLLRPLVVDGSAAALLERLGRFGDTIETQYESYWDQITDQPALRALFGLLARMRGAIDLRWVRTWAAAEAVDALQRTAPHYFRREADRWYFFHNSFREFLLNRTQEPVPGEPNTEVDRQLYRTLAEHCAATPADSPMSWDQLSLLFIPYWLLAKYLQRCLA